MDKNNTTVINETENVQLETLALAKKMIENEFKIATSKLDTAYKNGSKEEARAIASDFMSNMLTVKRELYEVIEAFQLKYDSEFENKESYSDENKEHRLAEIAYRWHPRFDNMTEEDFDNYLAECKKAGVTSLEVSEYMELHLDTN